jgi:hypothetical protein
MHLAAQSGNFEILHLFFDFKAELFEVNAKGQRPLHSFNNNLLLLKLLKKEEKSKLVHDFYKNSNFIRER